MAGDFNGDGHLDLAVATDGSDTRLGPAGQRRRHVPAPGHLRGGVGPSRHRGGGLQRDGHLDLAVANGDVRHASRCFWATATAHSSPRSPTRSGRTRAPSWRGTSTATATSTWPWQETLPPAQRRGEVSVLLGNGDGTFQPQVTYAVGYARPDAIRDRGGGLQRRRPPRPGRRSDADGVQILLGNGDGTFQPAGHCTRRAIPGRASWRGTSTATATSTWPSPTTHDDDVSVLLGNGDGTFQPQVTYATGAIPSGSLRAGSWRVTSRATAGSTWPSASRQQRRVGVAGQRRRYLPAPGSSKQSRWGRAQTAIVAGTSTATASSTWPSPTSRTACRCCWATATAPSSPRCTYRGGDRSRRHRGGGLQRRRPARPGRRQRNGCRHRVGAAGQRRRHVPARSYVRGGGGPDSHRGGGLQRRRPASTWPCVTIQRVTKRTTAIVSVLLGNGDGTFQPQVTYAVGADPDAIVAGDFNGDGRLDLAVAGSTTTSWP